MLFLSSGKITLKKTPGALGPRVRVEGDFSPHKNAIEEFFSTLPQKSGVVKRRFGRLAFSREFDEFTRQRIRNFLLSLAP